MRRSPAGAVIRLRRLAADAGLTELDVELLVISLVPDLDSRFERLYGYLNDDVTRRRATVGLALTLADVSVRLRGRAGPAAAGRAADRSGAGAGGGCGPAFPHQGVAGAGPGDRAPARR